MPEMHISITLKDGDAHLIRSVLEALHPETAHAVFEATQAVQDDRSEPDQAEAPLEAPTTASNPAAASLNGAAPQSNPEEETRKLIVGLYGRYKKAQTGTGKGNVTLRVDDEVYDADGQVGKVVALVRGRAVIQYDDGTGREVETPTLGLYVAEGGQEPAVPTTPGTEAGSAAADTGAGASEAPAVNPLEDDDDAAVVTRDDVRGLAEKYMERHDSAALLSLLKSNAGAQKVKEIPEQQLPLIYQLLEAGLR